MKNSKLNIANKKSVTEKGYVEITRSYQGPLPSPEVLHGFESILPGAAERIFVMAENEQKHRHSNQKKLTSWSIVVMILGAIFALLSVLFIGYLIYYCVNAKANDVAIALAITSMVGVSGSFVWFRYKRRSKEN